MGLIKHDYIVNLVEQEDSSLQESSNFAVPGFKWALITPNKYRTAQNFDGGKY